MNGSKPTGVGSGFHEVDCEVVAEGHPIRQAPHTAALTSFRSPPESRKRHYLFPNIQVNVGPFGFILVRTYPKPGDPARCISRISFYARPEPLEKFGAEIRALSESFATIIRDEDYAVAARSQLGAEAGIPAYNVFGRNEPALHHYHNTYREVLGMEPLELIPG